MDSPPPSDSAAAVAFYERRYAGGYMDDWPGERKQRIAELVSRLALPVSGDALDFGCGNGVLTDVLRQALPPGWRIFGTDISETAVRNAGARFPGCTFFAAGDPAFLGRRFDFLFTHHVLEHVADLQQVRADVSSRLQPTSDMLHVLPCGDPGSLEHEVCRLRSDGIDVEQGNRYFFEEPGHLRRLRSAEVIALFARDGFEPAMGWHANQHHGAVDWITQAGISFILRLTDPACAVDAAAARRLRELRLHLALRWCARCPVTGFERRMRERRKTARTILGLVVRAPLYLACLPFAKPVDAWLRRNARDEWRDRSTEAGGSETYLYLRRPGTGARGPVGVSPRA